MENRGENALQLQKLYFCLEDAFSYTVPSGTDFYSEKTLILGGKKRGSFVCTKLLRLVNPLETIDISCLGNRFSPSLEISMKRNCFHKVPLWTNVTG